MACTNACAPAVAPWLRLLPCRLVPKAFLAHPLQILDSAELDFSRYGDVLFEVAFAGARLTTGGNVSHEGKPLEFNVSRSCRLLWETDMSFWVHERASGDWCLRMPGPNAPRCSAPIPVA